MNSIPSKPHSEFRRQAVAKRRLGNKKICSKCGEARPEALIPRSKPRICAACQRKMQGKSGTDQHHVAGQNNHPGTVPVPVNDHRAVLSAKQLEWPLLTLRNPGGSPLLAVAACIRGFVDFVLHCIDRFLMWTVVVIEKLDAYLVEKLGPHWWVGTPLENYSIFFQEKN